MSSGSPLEPFLRSLIQGGRGDGGGDGHGQPTVLSFASDGVGGINPYLMLQAMGPNMVFGGGGGLGMSGPIAGSNRRGATPLPGMGEMEAASPGSVYNGGVPPMVWIQREQQRIPMQFSSTGSPNLDGVRLREEGNRAFKAGRFDEAIRYYTRAIEVDPDSEFNYTNRSFAYFKIKDYARSSTDAEKAIQVNANFFKGYFRLGLAQMSLNNFARAIENLRKAWALAPEAEKADIRVSIAKCESKMARAPVTPLLMSSKEASASCTSESGNGGHTAWQTSSSALFSDTLPVGLPPRPSTSSKADLSAISEAVQRTLKMRDTWTQYVDQYNEQDVIVECSRRSDRIRSLMSVATSNALSSLSKEAVERQAQLRRAVRQQDSNAYHESKRERDSTLSKLWSTAEAAEEAVKELNNVAKEEQKFFSRFGSAASEASSKSPTDVSQGAVVPSDISVASAVAASLPTATAAALPQAEHDGTGSGDAEKPVELPAPIVAVTQPATGDLPDVSSSTSTNATANTVASGRSPVHAKAELNQLLRRRDEINFTVCKAQKCFAATDAAGQALLRAMQAEAEAMKEVSPLMEEAAELNTQLEAHARLVASTTTKELSDVRLQALEQVSNLVERLKADKVAFSRTMYEGDKLLEEEAKLEQQRLLLERQRIQLQAEVEWFKVRDEPESKVAALQGQVKRLHQQIATIHDTQKKVQTRIMELVEQDHPELAWKSMANGSRILRLVKGSGLWQNLSFSDFQIVSTLSSTVNSKVYHAVRRGEHVAVKEVPVDDELARRRFQREVNIVSACNHPNIIRIKGVFFDGPFSYILLPYYHRSSLRTVLSKQEPISWVTVQDTFRQLASGIAYLHERGIVHGDIKPSNVLMADDGRPVISDFGIAKDHGVLGVADVTLTSTTTNSTTGDGVKGTLQYMAPEQLSHEPGSEKPKSTARSDMWALGVTMLEVALQNAGFHEHASTKPALPLLLPEQKRIEVPAKAVGGDEKLAEAISSLLVADPEHRATAYDLLADPYFSSSLNPVNSNQNSSALAKSDERIDAVRSYIHAVRHSHQQKVLVSVARNHMVESVRDIFKHLSSEDLLCPIMVVFQGEAGIDEGALATEMLNLFYDQMVMNKKALVCVASDETSSTPTPDTSVANGATVSGTSSALFSTVPYLPAPDAAGVSPELFLLLGKVLLKSIIESRQIPLLLSTAVLKYLCGVEPSFADLEEYDATMASTLKRLRLLSAAELSDTGLDFSHFTSEFLMKQTGDRYTTESLLTTDNLGEYIDLRVAFDLVECRRAALEAMKKGFYCVPELEHHLKLLSPSDLLLLLCGQAHISAQAIVDALDFQGFSRSSNTPKYLKEVLLDMSQNNLRRFLQLCTAMAAVPAGRAMQKIKVLRCADEARLPVGHGCTNQLDLPDYDDKEVVREKLEITLAHASDGFHIV